MALVFFASVLLVACSRTKALVLPSSPEQAGDVQSLPATRNSRCQVDLMQNIQKTILESLSLQSEPHILFPEMAKIREHFKTAFRGSGQLNSEQPKMTDNTTSPGNCCKFASQIFIKDLGWDDWIIYPESFTYIHCSACDIRMATPCRDESASDSVTSQVPCCEPTGHYFVPFLYLDKTLTITSVQLTRECGCRPDAALQDPKP